MPNAGGECNSYGNPAKRGRFHMTPAQRNHVAAIVRQLRYRPDRDLIETWLDRDLAR
jgi:hypothetical protein